MKKILLFLCAIFFATGAGSTGIGANDTTASCDNNTLGQTSGTANIEVDWQPNTIDIRWYSDDTRLSVQNSAKSCVYDDDLYLPAQPTKTGYTFKGWTVKHAIPAEYTELEYIETTNDIQWINTGIHQNSASNNIETYAGFSYSVLPTKRELMGFDGNGNNYWGVYIKDNNKVVFECSAKGSYAISANTKYDIYVKQFFGTVKDINLRAYLNGTLVENIVGGGRDMDDSLLFIFAIQAAVGNYYVTHGRIHYYRVLVDGVLVGNFIPVRRNSDNELGVYDTVSKTFKNNSGNGTFIAGPVVQ